MVSSPLIPLPRPRSGRIVPIFINRGSVRKMYASLPRNYFLKNQLTDENKKIGVLLGEWWGSTIYSLCYVRDVTNNLATNKSVGVLQNVQNLGLKVFGVNATLKGLGIIIKSTEKLNVAAVHHLADRLDLEKVSV